MGVATLAFAVFAPVPYAFAASADGSAAPAASASCSPVATPPAGIQQPTGAAAGTYSYNSCTGLWENAYYTWDPVTKAYTPKAPYIYSCDTTTWQWTTMQWVYSPVSRAYAQIPLSVAQLPAGAQTAAGSPLACAPVPAPAATSPTTASTTTKGSADPSTSVTNTASTALNSAATATIANQLGSVALSGAADVTGNTAAGDAASGNATAAANILNSVNSSSALNGGNVVLFTANIDGNVQGNLIVDPSQLQPAGGSSALDNTNTLTVNAKDSGQIANTVNLDAASGNATVAHNTTAGNATSGNADAVANVVNELNSIVGAGKSFIGTININGNLNGNILVPQSFLDSLIATNAPSTTVALSPSETNSLGIETTTNQAIDNTVHSTAATGTASVTGNTAAGNATSGNGSTKVTIFNLTGHQVVGANCLLVFVNVAGTWVGVIMNAPAGATAAALGGGITGNATNDATVNAATNNSIANDITVAAQSGDAAVTDNSQAGNARSGNADTAVNLLNLNNSQLSLSGWFGVLFINVFGNWFGNFGAYTPPVAGGQGGGPKPSDTANNEAPAAPKVFRFVTQQPAAAAPADDTPLPTVGAELASTAGRVLGTGMSKLPKPAGTSRGTASTSRPFQAVGGILMAAGLSSLAVERLATARRSRRTTDL